MKILRYSLLIIAVCFMSNCNKQHTFSINQDLPDSGWHYDNILKYEFQVEDTNALYDLYLELDYLTSFPNQNVYVNIYTGQQPDKMKKTTLSLDISNKLGIWKGACSAESCTYLLPLQKSIFFEQRGKQYFWVEQYSRTENLKGIRAIKLVGDIVGEKGGDEG